MNKLDIDKPEVVLAKYKKRMERLFLRGEREVVRLLLAGKDVSRTDRRYRRLLAVLSSDYLAEMDEAYVWYGDPDAVDPFPGLEELLVAGHVDAEHGVECE